MDLEVLSHSKELCIQKMQLGMGIEEFASRMALRQKDVADHTWSKSSSDYQLHMRRGVCLTLAQQRNVSVD